MLKGEFMQNLGNEFEVREYDLKGYGIGSFVFNHREIENEAGEKEVELDVYKYSEPVLLYVKTFKAPYIEEASPIDLCEALYKEFYLSHDEEENKDK